MREEMLKRDYFWIVEAVDNSGIVLFSGTYTDFNSAWDKYYSYKDYKRKATVSLQRRFKEYKLA